MNTMRRAPFKRGLQGRKRHGRQIDEGRWVGERHFSTLLHAPKLVINCPPPPGGDLDTPLVITL